MPDPTDEAVAAMTRSFTAKVKEHPMPRSQPWDPPGAAAFFGCPTEDAMRVALDAIPTDVLARVVADRSDQPTPGPVLAEGTIYRYEDDGGPVIRVALDAVNVRRADLVDRQVTVHATGPHTP